MSSAVSRTLDRPDLAQAIEELTSQGGVDLHLHSTCSDGSEKPAEVARLMFKARLRAFALTDHDTTRGLEEALQVLTAEAEQHPQEPCPVFLPGTELSLNFEGQEVHLLGYFPTLSAAWQLRPFLRAQEVTRDKRNLLLIEAMQKQGMPIRFEDLTRLAPHKPGRVHAALWLIENGYVKDTHEAFRRFLGPRGSCYVPRERVSLKEGIEQIHAAGGTAFMAHPHEYNWCDMDILRRKLGAAKALGLDGVEAFHSDADDAQRRRLSLIACELRLARSGGSDWHGKNRAGRPYYTDTTRFDAYYLPPCTVQRELGC